MHHFQTPKLLNLVVLRSWAPVRFEHDARWLMINRQTPFDSRIVVQIPNKFNESQQMIRLIMYLHQYCLFAKAIADQCTVPSLMAGYTLYDEFKMGLIDVSANSLRHCLSSSETTAIGESSPN